MIVPQNFRFVYSTYQCAKDIIKMTSKYNWSEEEKRLLTEMIGKVRRTGAAQICGDLRKDPTQIEKIKNHIDNE